MPRPTVQRPRITGITINVLMPDGSTRTHTIDPVNVEALFWSPRAVKEILGGFYDGKGKGKKISKNQVRDTFGEQMADRVFGAKAERDLDGVFIDALWENPKEGDMSVAFLTKTIVCVPTNG